MVFKKSCYNRKNIDLYIVSGCTDYLTTDIKTEKVGLDNGFNLTITCSRDVQKFIYNRNKIIASCFPIVSTVVSLNARQHVKRQEKVRGVDF